MNNFIIFAQPSTGSSLLATVFTLHPDVKMYFEYQNYNHWENLAAYANQQGSVFGNKFISWDLSNRLRVLEFESVITNFKVIHLNRHLADLHDSYTRKIELEGNNKLGTHQEYTPAKRQLHEQLWNEHEEHSKRMEEIGVDLIRVEYGEFINNPHDTCKRITDFLELPYVQEAVDNAPRNNRNQSQRRNGYTR